MKRRFVLSALMLFLAVSFAVAQDIPQSQVPSVVVNKFQQDFPQARDVDWELKRGNYEVEFEVGRHPDRDHEILYSPAGEVLRHKQEIAKEELPDKVTAKLASEFPGYRIKDVEKIEDGGKTVYKLEAKAQKEEWDLQLDAEGNIINKKRD